MLPGDGAVRWWLFVALVSLAWVAGILLIDDETAQLVFMVLLLLALIGGNPFLSRLRGGRAQPEEDDGRFLFIALLLAVLLANFFASGDAERAAMVPLAVVLAALWSLGTALRRRRAAARPL